MTTIDLYCLPFAGGNKYSYREFQEYAPSGLNIIPLEYPGRGARMGEALLSDMNAMLSDLYRSITRSNGQNEYAIYGHSMGGVLAFLLARKIVAENYPSPKHIFITGTITPAADSGKRPKRHLLGKKEFMEEIQRLDGSPEEVLRNDELLDYLEPILRADFKLIESYTYEYGNPLCIPFTVITGTEEDLKDEEIQLWQKETICPVDFRKMPGRHFFIWTYVQEIVELIADKLSNPVKVQSYE